MYTGEKYLGFTNKERLTVLKLINKEVLSAEKKSNNNVKHLENLYQIQKKVKHLTD